jgi:hypothetical protein
MSAWSQTRFFVTLAIAVLIVMEPVSWITAPIPGGCIVNPENYAAYYSGHDDCPTFHVFLIDLAIRVFRHFGDPNWVIADFTAVLAFSTICLWAVTWRASIRQSRDMEASIAVAAKSAEAAKLQADILFAVESSVFDFAGFKLVEYLYPDGLDGREVSGRDPAKTPPIPEYLRALIAITNLGKAPLRLTGMCVEYGVGKALPPDPFYLSLNGVNKVIERGQISEWFMQPNIFQLDQDQRRAIDTGAAFLWVYGFVFYIGLLREPRQLGFAVRWDSQAGAFILRGPPAYSYDREITQ